MIRGVVFDNGGVLVEDQWDKFIKEIKSDSKINYKFFKEELGPVIEKAKHGKGTFNDFLLKLNTIAPGYKVMERFNRDYPLRNDVLEWASSLNNQYDLAILSNDLGDFEEKNRYWELDKIFGKNIFCSSIYGVSKPNEDIFLLVLNKMNLKPEEVIFIDDKERNVVAAGRLGIKAIQFKTLEQAKLEFEKIIEKDGER